MLVEFAKNKGFIPIKNGRLIANECVTHKMILDWIVRIHKMDVLIVDSQDRWVFRIVFLDSKLNVQHTTTDDRYETSLAALLQGIVQVLLFLNTPEFSLN